METEMQPGGAEAKPGAGRDTGSRHGGRRIARIAAMVIAPVLALGVAWWATRPSRTSNQAVDGTDHSTMGMATSDSAHPVMLDAEGARRIGVTFAQVSLEPLGEEIRTVGQVTVDETQVRTIALKVDGWVERLDVDFTGQHVDSGQTLLTLYSPMLVTAQEELLLARRLVDDVASGTAETRETAVDLAESARRRLRWWDISEAEIARVERAGTAQRTLTFLATATGVVLEKNVVAGQRVMAGEPLYRVADLSSVWVDGEVYERDLRAIRVGQRVAADFDALPGQQLVGRVAYVYPTLAGETRTVRVRVTLPNPRLLLKPGMYATLRIQSDRRGSVLTVPRGAVLATGERFLVFVRAVSGQLEPRIVEVGAASDDRIEILRGVTAGETVVASATFLIDAESNLGAAVSGMANMPVMPALPKPSAPGDTHKALSHADAHNLVVCAQSVRRPVADGGARDWRRVGGADDAT